MLTEQSLPEYDSIEDALQQLNIPLTAAEAHGIISGIYCATNDTEHALQLLLNQSDQPIEDDDVLQQEAQRQLQQLMQITVQQFTDANFGLQLLLQSDSQPLSLRSADIGHWCQGFISGLGEANIDQNAEHHAEIRELIFTLSEIGQIDSEDIEETEQDEKDFHELYEFIRVAALTIHTDLILDNKNVVEHKPSTTVH